MAREIRITGTLTLSASDAWRRVITTDFILNMSEPFFHYRMLEPISVPEVFSEGRYVMRAISPVGIPLDHQVVVSTLRIDASSGLYSINNVSKGWPYSWDHQITLQDNGDGTTTYVDEIDVLGGPAAAFFRALTRRLFKQRQKNWGERFRHDGQKLWP